METISEEDRAKTKKKEADRIKAMRQEKSKEEKIKTKNKDADRKRARRKENSKKARDKHTGNENDIYNYSIFFLLN